MSTHSSSRTLPYTCEQLFDLAADVESYPDFMPGWVEARILEHSSNCLRVEQRLGLKLVPLPFITTAVLDRPHKLSIHSSDGPFRSLQIEWYFEPVDPGHCRASLDFNFQLRTGILKPVVTALLDHLSPEIISRFDERAQMLYGINNAG